MRTGVLLNVDFIAPSLLNVEPDSAFERNRRKLKNSLNCNAKRPIDNRRGESSQEKQKRLRELIQALRRIATLAKNVIRDAFSKRAQKVAEEVMSQRDSRRNNKENGKEKERREGTL